MSVTIRTTATGTFVPDELPDMVEDQILKVTLNLSGIAGSNTISGTPTATCDTLTLGSVTLSGKEASFTVTADNLGTHHILASATLSNGETFKGYVRACVKAAPCSDTRDYA